MKTTKPALEIAIRYYSDGRVEVKDKGSKLPFIAFIAKDNYKLDHIIPTVAESKQLTNEKTLNYWKTELVKTALFLRTVIKVNGKKGKDGVYYTTIQLELPLWCSQHWSVSSKHETIGITLLTRMTKDRYKTYKPQYF